MSAIETAFVNAVISRDDNNKVVEEKLEEAGFEITPVPTKLKQNDSAAENKAEARRLSSQAIVQDGSPYVSPTGSGRRR